MNVYYSGWGFIQVDGENNEIIERRTLTEYDGIFKLHEKTMESFNIVEKARVHTLYYYDDELNTYPAIMKHFNDFKMVQSWLVISDKEGNPMPITIEKGNVLFECPEAGRLKLLDVSDTQEEVVISNASTVKQDVEPVENELSERSESSYLLTIAVLLDCIQKKPPFDQLQDFSTDKILKDEICDYYGLIHGISEKSLSDKFAKSRKMLKDKK